MKGEFRRVAVTAPDGQRVTAMVREGREPALVLIPGTWGNADTRGPLVDRLDPKRKLVCVALAGQDDNWPPPERPGILLFSGHVLALAEHLGLGPFVPAGNSLGGMIAIDLLRWGPDRVRGAVAIEGWTHWSVLREAFGDDVDGTLTAGQRAFLAEVRTRLLARWDPVRRAAYNRVWTEWDGEPILRETVLPVLEIWGDRGRPPPPRVRLRVPDLPGIRLVWIAGASHNLLVEAPARVAEAVEEFMREVDRTLNVEHPTSNIQRYGG